jgi:DNA-nicking Smr family endonuclease
VAKKPFNNPFAGVKLAPEPAAPPPPRAAPPPDPPAEPREPSEAELWAEATAGAHPVTRGPARVEPPLPHGRAPAFYHPDLDALDALKALVSGEGSFDVADTDEFIEGRVTGLDPAIVRRLRKGEFAVQGHVDLHGLTRAEARAEVERFLRAARSAGKRCVLVVHGRGLHSDDQVPVLKEALKTWLAQGRFARHVLAFASARPSDGGTGAVYVLLRRAGR